MGLFGKLLGWSRSRKPDSRRRRRLFLEPLEGRQLLATLMVTKVGDPPSIDAGSDTNLNYQITITGDPVEDATNVLLTDLLPPNTQQFSWQPDPSWTDTSVPGVSAGATIALLPANAVANFTLSLNVLSSAPAGTLTNDVSVTLDNGTATGDLSEDTTITTAAEIQISKSGPAQAAPGQLITYSITANDAGPSDAQTVTVTDTLPSNATLISADQLPGTTTFQRNIGAGMITWTANTLPKSDAEVFVVVVQVDAGVTTGTQLTNSAGITSPTAANGNQPGDDSALVTTTVVAPAPDVAVTKTGPATVIAGNDLTYTIHVVNNGDVASGLVNFSDGILTNTTFVSATFPAGWTRTDTTQPGNNGTILANIPSLAAHAASDITIVVHVPASAPTGTNRISNEADVNTNGDSNSLNDSSTALTSVTAQADLGVTKTGPATAAAGADVTYTITVTNIGGPSDARTVTLTDAVPANTTFVSFTPPAGWTPGVLNPLPGGSGTVTATIPSLAVGASGVFTLVVHVNPDAASNATVTNQALISASGSTDIVGGNNNSTVNTTVNVVSDLSVTKTDSPDPVVAGNNLTYTMTVRNSGPSDNSSVTLSDVVPLNTTFVSFAGGPNGTTITLPDGTNGNTATAQFGPLAAGGTATFTMIVTVNQNAPIGPAAISNTANVSGDPGDPNDANNHVTATTQVNSPPSADVAVTKSDSPDPVSAGANLTYSITVTNNGTDDASTVVLTDSIPASTTFVSLASPAGWSSTTPSVGGTGQVRSTRATLVSAAPPAVFTLIVKVGAGTTSGTTITNTASVSTTSTEFNTGNNTTPNVNTTVQTQADLSVTKVDTPDPVFVGSNLTYTITVNNLGPSNAQSVQLSDSVPANTTFVSFTAPTGWTSTTPTAGGTGAIQSTIATMAPAGVATFRLVVNVNATTGSGTLISNTAGVSSTTPDSQGANNNATASTTVLAQLDLGDAPDTYGTTLAANGARHTISSSLHLGAAIDFETNGQPTALANGDDITGIDDEDGVVLPGGLIPGRNGAVIVTASAAGKLDAWIDFDRNGVFDATDRLGGGSLSVVAGTNTISFAVPATAVAGGTFARFRLSSAGGLGPTGSAPDGEVEDYAVPIITVAPGSVGIIPNPEAPGENMLSIVGTAASDTISVSQLRSPLLKAQVVFDKHTFGPFSMANFREIVVFGGAGNDTVQINMSRPATIHGEAGFDRLFGGGGYDHIYGDFGNDTISGGGGADILVGGAGNDTISGGAGRDILIGGTGVDSLKGDQGDDILIGGTTTADSNTAALDSVLATWNNVNVSFQTRVSRLAGLLNSGTVQDDGARDRLEGGVDHDWYLDFGLADTLVGFNRQQDKKNL